MWQVVQIGVDGVGGSGAVGINLESARCER